ncbi:MAG: CNNM domain-containing protein [Gammaproteobacteria bacterium]
MSAGFWTLFLIFIGGLLLSALSSMVEAAVISQDRHRLAHLADSGSRPARIMQKMTENMERLLAAVLLLNNIANVLCATAAAVAVTRLAGGGEGAAFAASLLVAFLILVLSEISPKIIGVRHSLAISLACAFPLQILLAILRPLIAVANFLARGVLLLAGVRRAGGWHTAMDISELRSAVRHSNRRAEEANDEKGGRHYYMVEQLLRLADMPVEKIMTPRREIEGINLQDNESALYEQIMRAGRTKMPVFNGNIDATEGFINTLQAIKTAARRGKISAADLRAAKTPPLFIPAAADALRQMEIMRRDNNPIALVVDGAGRVSGLVTFSNFSAAVIGGEKPPEDAVRGADGSYTLPGDFPLIQLGDLYPHLPAPETSAASIGGLIMEAREGNPPAAGEFVEVGGMRLQIIQSGTTSVRRVRLLPPEKPPGKN